MEKRVSALQLVLQGETIADGERRHAEARAWRDATEARLIERLLIEELTRWESGILSAESQAVSGSSMERIMVLAQQSRHEASDAVVQELKREGGHQVLISAVAIIYDSLCWSGREQATLKTHVISWDQKILTEEICVPYKS